MQKITVILPAYNEEKYILKVIQGIKKEGFKNIVVVDDCSSDKTLKIAKKANVFIIKNRKNLGKSLSVRKACDKFYKKTDIIVLMDSDGQHDPKEIKKLLRNLKKADLVIGYRKRNKNMPLFYKIGNLFFDMFTFFLLFKKIKDTQSGFRAFNTKIYKKIRWEGKGYSAESEMIIKAVKNKVKIAQVPIKTIYHEKYKGTTLFDGIKIALRMLKLRLFN